ncbi:MAG: PEP-CTERM sorting domain-containing protein [Armatimonadota bacterium]
MLRWIVSLTTLVAVSSVFAQGTFLNSDTSSKKSSFCDTTPPKSDPAPYKCDTTPPNCNPKPPTQCVPEPTSVAALAVGGLGLLVRRKKKNNA